MAVSLPNVTVVAIDCVAHALTREALRDTLRAISPGDVLVWCDRDLGLGVTTLPCDVRTSDDAFRLRWYEVPARVRTSHFLCLEWDSWVLDGAQWRDEWLAYDYIGAPWWYQDGMNVGNGGFSLRSTNMARYVAASRTRFPYHPGAEDHVLCRMHRPELEKCGFRWAPDNEAERFAFENKPPSGPTFGFHGVFNWPRVLDRERLLERLDLVNNYVRSKPEWSRLLAAVQPTQAAPAPPTTTDPDLHLVLAGQRIDAVSAEDGTYIFDLETTPAELVILASRCGVPAQLGLSPADERRLGVAIKSIELRQGVFAISFGPDTPLFVQPGCFPPDGRFCWTTGRMELPAWLFAYLPGPVTLRVATEGNGMRYALSAQDAAA